MLSRAQQILLKRAQAEAGLSDADYRDALEGVSGMAGCRSSKDGRLGDRHVDLLLGYFEAIYWRQPHDVAVTAQSRNRVFRQVGYWAGKNPRGNTSRDRFADEGLSGRVAALEGELGALGFGGGYCAAIRQRIEPWSLWAYRAALERTLASKRRAVGEPF